MTVGDLKEMCEDILYTLDNYDDDLNIRLSANTYGVGYEFIATYDGFLPIPQIEDRIETDDDENY